MPEYIDDSATTHQVDPILFNCIMILCFYTHGCLPHIKAYTTQTLEKFKEYTVNIFCVFIIYKNAVVLTNKALCNAVTP